MDYLNPDLDFAALGRTLRTEGRVLIRDFFTPQVAEALDRALQAIDWELVYRDATGDRRLTGEQLRSLTPQQRMQLTEGIHGIAREGFQFSFFSDSLVRAVKDGRSDLLAASCAGWRTTPSCRGCASSAVTPKSMASSPRRRCTPAVTSSPPTTTMSTARTGGSPT
ncbi:hypothetical protein [Mitsuaria sp. TWR114]|uniref:hypothetical protein n=1 Tax=Mitsuaria sp. TWR114 TaxID=2601731 RepID=UPI0021043178|nr:hypothetical protein [Mitsuaria sp. TWR114]